MPPHAFHFPAIARTAVAALAALCVAAGASAAALQPQVRTMIESFVAQRAGGPADGVTVQVEDPASALPACSQLQPFVPEGVKPWGRVPVGVRCVGERPWTRFLVARVKVEGNYLVAARAIAPGTVLGAADVQARHGDLTALPRDVAIDPAVVTGMVAVNTMAAGAPLRLDLLRGAVVVRQGQTVRVLLEGNAFLASTEARALTDGIAGRMLQVKTHDGRLLAGRLTRDGAVTLAP